MAAGQRDLWLCLQEVTLLLIVSELFVKQKSWVSLSLSFASHIVAFATSIMFQIITSKLYMKLCVCLKTYESNAGTRTMFCVGEQWRALPCI